jgi:hypothetical protein
LDGLPGPRRRAGGAGDGCVVGVFMFIRFGRFRISRKISPKHAASNGFDGGGQAARAVKWRSSYCFFVQAVWGFQMFERTVTNGVVPVAEKLNANTSPGRPGHSVKLTAQDLVCQMALLIDEPENFRFVNGDEIFNSRTHRIDRLHQETCAYRLEPDAAFGRE